MLPNTKHKFHVECFTNGSSPVFENTVWAEDAKEAKKLVAKEAMTKKIWAVHFTVKDLTENKVVEAAPVA